jgi:hypothetical protein
MPGSVRGGCSSECVAPSLPTESAHAVRCCGAYHGPPLMSIPACSCMGRRHVRLQTAGQEDMHTCTPCTWISSQLALLARGDQPHEVHGHCWRQGAAPSPLTMTDFPHEPDEAQRRGEDHIMCSGRDAPNLMPPCPSTSLAIHRPGSDDVDVSSPQRTRTRRRRLRQLARAQCRCPRQHARRSRWKARDRR